jgi:hypothetical protein
MHSFCHIHETKKRTWISTFFNTLIEEDFGVAIDLMSLASNIVKIDLKKRLLSNLWEPTTLRIGIYIYTPGLIIKNTYFKRKKLGQFLKKEWEPPNTSLNPPLFNNMHSH